MTTHRHTTTAWAATPDDWTTCRVKALFHDTSDTISAQELAELVVDHYSIPAFDEHGAPSREEGVTIASNKTLLRGGELLYSKLNCHKPRAWLVPANDAIKVASTEFIPLSEWHPDLVDKKFMWYLLGSKVFADYMTCFQTSVTNSHRRISPNDLWQTRIPLPGLTEQRQIAAYLDASCAGIDAAVTAKRRQLDTLESVQENLIESAVTKGLDHGAPRQTVNEDWLADIPAHWEACRIKRVLSRVDYGISESTEPEGRFPVLKMGHIQQREIEIRDLDFVDEVDDDLLLQVGDVLYNRTNSPDQVGKAAVFRGSMSGPVTFASYLVRLRTNHRADPYFLNYVVNSSGFLSFARKLAIPSVQQSNLNSTRYCRILMPRPPIGEQREIVAYLDAKLQEVRGIADCIETQINTLNGYRKSLVHEYVTGQSRVTDADVKQIQSYV